MNRRGVPKSLRDQVALTAGHRCGYCLSSVRITGIPLEVEHLVPVALGGATVEANLWFSCVSCNRHKADRTEAVDPHSGARVPLFHPRSQDWKAHFEWSADGALVVGRTAIGRATVVALDLNHHARVAARRRWVVAGWHPPRD